MNRKWALRLGFAALRLGIASILVGADIKVPPWDKSHLSIGRDLFRENCVVCHDIDKDQRHTKKLGPSLNHLFKNERLPLSHGNPSRPYVVVRIKFGGAFMPAFGKRLSQSEIDTLIDYVATK
jgi:mono/diheme cytochrome c family protein